MNVAEINIMIIDDSPATVAMNTLLLTEMGIAKRITSAGNVSEALASLEAAIGEEGLPDLILLDVELGEHSAFDFLSEYQELLEKNDQKPTAKICIVSDNLLKRGNFDKLKAYAPVGVVDQLRKPIDPEDVLELFAEE